MLCDCFIIKIITISIKVLGENPVLGVGAGDKLFSVNKTSAATPV